MTVSRAVAGLLVSLAFACTGPSTTIEQSWQARTGALQRPRNVVVLYSARDGSIRRTLEDKMAYELQRRGVAATPSYAVLDMRGYDGLVAIHPVGRPLETSGVAPHNGGDPWPIASDTDYGFVGQIVRLETEVYSLPDDRLVYSALSRTVEPANVPVVIDEVTNLVAHELARQGVVVATRR